MVYRVLGGLQPPRTHPSQQAARDVEHFVGFSQATEHPNLARLEKEMATSSKAAQNALIVAADALEQGHRMGAAHSQLVEGMRLEGQAALRRWNAHANAVKKALDEHTEELRFLRRAMDGLHAQQQAQSLSFVAHSNNVPAHAHEWPTWWAVFLWFVTFGTTPIRTK